MISGDPQSPGCLFTTMPDHFRGGHHGDAASAQAITLTEAPNIVALKREFFLLDRRELELRSASGAGYRPRTAAELEAICAVSDLKSALARKIHAAAT